MIEQLKKHITYYLISGFLLAIIVTSINTVKAHNSSLRETLEKFPKIKSNVVRMKAELANIDLMLSKVNDFIPSDYKESSPEKKIFVALDMMKSQLQDAKISVQNIEDTGDLISLDVNIAGISNSYTNLVDAVGNIMSLKFPFYEINSIVLSENSNKNVSGFSYKINGKLHSPKNQN